MSIEALPCIICGIPLKNVWEEADNQPSDGVACTTNGNYGSTVYDPVMTAEFLEFNICDPCLVKAGAEGRIYAARVKVPIYMDGVGLVGWADAPYRPVVWHAGMPGYNDNIEIDDLEEVKTLGNNARLMPDITQELVDSILKQQ
jgi:hypothetical protein